MHIIVANNSIQPQAFDAAAQAQALPQRLPTSGATAASPARQQMLECSVGQLLRHLHPGVQGEARQVRMAFAQQELRVFARIAECCAAGLADRQHEQLQAQQRASEGMLFGNLPAALNLGVQADVPFFDKLIELIGVIRDDYLSVYEHVLDVYTKFYAAFTDQITSKMSGWFEADKDGKKIIFQRATFESALRSLIQQFEYQPSQLVPIPGAAPMNEDEARNWQRALGLPDYCLSEDGNGNWVVYMDTAPVIAILQGLPPSGPGGTPPVIDTAKFNAWQSGFNAQEERLKNMLQSITSKYANANTYHDNFNKTLSAHLSQYADLLKHMTTL
ncbi:IpaD/SipD/SspD family type III secretion system needle tip protein [Pseudomonas rubra]|uniref:IpaD/SipD/SspD family type III secretion system needle tip protein n=1 Tax=Pseudomonas rubra TaxID=2942627 RepID=A0ABT5PCH7_9PSED|nr:IpaD/SipD/SspD family type III secretion system needle tip protein [Pseudomonas rubra]MDD1016003.1 IpaD/SipD/SspD family type III secretion system needle tip protein [Pseudomonas rubra]MDD1039226.1 IpaD/SipD/SspD family type III secretion system needle tip protein [Pseudomonas rubra]MDD1155196.1 IpaD/SipD/SspD family type III secretion system needle tip protein [Pseudomonas rubra]